MALTAAVGHDVASGRPEPPLRLLVCLDGCLQ